MSEPTDPKMAFVLMVKEHIKCPQVQTVARLLASDQYAGFWEVSFTPGKEYRDRRWEHQGGLAEALFFAYRAMRIYLRTAEAIWSKIDEDRMVGLLVVVMASRWINLRTLDHTFAKNQPVSAKVMAISNAIAVGYDLTPNESQALCCWQTNAAKGLNDFEDTTPEWWVLTQTMQAVFAANRKT